jgi:hypothetical protein
VADPEFSAELAVVRRFLPVLDPADGSQRRGCRRGRPALQPPLRRRPHRGAFAVRLREQVDLDALSVDLLAVVEQTMQPTQASLWLWPVAATRPSR